MNKIDTDTLKTDSMVILEALKRYKNEEVLNQAEAIQTLNVIEKYENKVNTELNKKVKCVVKDFGGYVSEYFGHHIVDFYDQDEELEFENWENKFCESKRKYNIDCDLKENGSLDGEDELVISGKFGDILDFKKENDDVFCGSSFNII